MTLVLVLAVAVAVLFAYQRGETARVLAENQALKAEADLVAKLKAENERLAGEAARTRAAPATNNNEQLRELMRLRGEVGTLRQTTREAVAAADAKENPPSVMSGLSRNPEMVKMIRDQQKLGLGMIYKEFSAKANLPKETAESLNDLLADHVMTNINHLTELLASGKSAAEMDKVFAAQEAQTDLQVKELLGDDAYKSYKDYNYNLASLLTAEQFKGMMLQGDKEKKDAQGKQLYELMQEETARALAAAGLPKDYQTVPTLNFRNIASDEFAEKNLQLLDNIYESVASRAGGFLSTEELEKFGEFRKMAINNNRLALTVNRKMMAPPNK